MKQFVRLSAMIIIMIMLTGCRSWNTVSVIVRDASTGQPLQDVRVHASHHAPKYNLTRRVEGRTDVNGKADLRVATNFWITFTVKPAKPEDIYKWTMDFRASDRADIFWSSHYDNGRAEVIDDYTIEVHVELPEAAPFPGPGK